jgi:hypothetical protein
MVFMAKYCVYCGKPVKQEDKFCINCGKPLLSNIPKVETKSKLPIVEKPKEEKIKAEDKEKEKVKDKDKQKAEEKTEEEEEKDEDIDVDKLLEEKEKLEKGVKPLPNEVKQHIDLYLEINDIEMKKKALADKLNDLQKSLKSSKYDTDFGFGEKVNIQLKAAKTIMEELKQKENELKQQMKDKFIVEKLNYDIETKRSQLKNLMTEFKLKKLKDKDVVKKLKEKYKQQLDDYISEKADLIAGIQLWIDEIKQERIELDTDRKFNKARFSSKEISEKEFKEKDTEFDNKINKLDGKINTLENLTKKKK